jgi:hypothetical protein
MPRLSIVLVLFCCCGSVPSLAASASYGRLVTTLATDQQTVRVHHTEYTLTTTWA